MEKESQELVKTDFGEIFIKRQGNMIFKPMKAKMILSVKRGHLYEIQKKWTISSDGYIHLNKVASINLVTPQMVIVDGIEKSNPCVERNPKTKAIETVNVRKIGIGFSPVGNLTVVDNTLFYNIYTYFIQSIQAKMKRKIWRDGKMTNELEHPNCAVIGIEKECPEKEGKWTFFETTAPLGIWINYEDPAIIDCLEEHTQRQRFGDRIAQKICMRNILKFHPAIGISQVEVKNDQAEITVYGWRHQYSAQDINEIMERAERGAEDIEKVEKVIEPEPEEEKAIIEETRAEENGAESPLFQGRK